VVSPEEASRVDLRTQVETTEGRPDLEIRWADCLVVVEVKVESALHKGQLEGYRVYLRESEAPRSLLVLLTRYAVAFDEGDERPDLALHWHEVADLLAGEYQAGAIADPAALFLCRQFLDFLEARTMSLAQVGWQMGEGVRAHRNLLVMLEEVARGCRLSVKKVTTWDSIGFQLDKKFWVGVHYDAPTHVRFQTEGCRIDPTAANSVGVGLVIAEDWAPGGLIWRHVAELESEQVAFFARSKARQIQWLESFLREALAMARRIEAPEQAA